MMNASLAPIDLFFVCLLRVSVEAAILIGLVLLAQRLFRNQLTPKWRHALWFLVIFRLLLPWSLPSPVSLFNLFSESVPFLASGSPVTANTSAESPDFLARPASAGSGSAAAASPDAYSPTFSHPQHSWVNWLVAVWLIPVVVLGVGLLSTTWRMRWRVRRCRALTDAEVLELLEDCKEEMTVYTPLAVIETAAVTSPSLYGFIRPRLLLPAGLTRSFSRPELRHVFLHELAHVKRHDILLNWLTTLLLIVHWFNPLVWYAFSRMQADRELACDALALARSGERERHSYGGTIIKLLEHFSCPARLPGMAGILENRNQMKGRITMIAKFKEPQRWPIVAALLFTGLALLCLTDACSPSGSTKEPGPGTTTAAPKSDEAAATAPADKEGPPEIVATSPEVGATDVDPATTEITVTFDRDMGEGFSWTGGGADFPQSPAGQRPHWRDKRTCVLPVKLEAAHYYRVGINSMSYHGFSSAEGVPASPSAIYFTTKGASEQMKRMASTPRIVGLVPKNGMQDVDPNLTEIRVTFNVPMGGGFSWTGGGPDFPTVPEGKKPYWTEDHKTCVLPVQLQPGHTYHLGLNSPSHKNFQSEGGVPLAPARYSFTTR